LAPGTEFYEEPKYPNIWRKVNYYKFLEEIFSRQAFAYVPTENRFSEGKYQPTLNQCIVCELSYYHEVACKPASSGGNQLSDSQNFQKHSPENIRWWRVDWGKEGTWSQAFSMEGYRTEKVVLLIL